VSPRQRRLGPTAPPPASARAATPSNLEAAIVERALELGFDQVCFAEVEPPPDEDHRRFRDYVASGRHGTMGYLARGLEARARVDGTAILAGARSVICVARSYHRPTEALATDRGIAPLIARYARGLDYHAFMRAGLRALARFVMQLGRGARARGLCDTAPVLERAWAARAGVGFVGKSNMLISPTHGSELLLGEVVTDLRLAPTSPVEPGCGACTMCLDACPSGALVAPFQLDARRCVSYLTIEHRGPVAAELESAAGTSLFGCDRCQLGCPYNGPRCVGARDAGPFRPMAAWHELGLADLVDQAEPLWRERSRGSPLARLDAHRIARNALHVAHRLLEGEPDQPTPWHAEALAALEAGRRARDPATVTLARRLGRAVGL
jgi:epoxyqueuosine reductase